MSFQITLDAASGGRWSSLRDDSGHEWLWSRPDPRRATAVPGDPFVDVGGVEECFPTLSCGPDHGDVWARPWRLVGQAPSGQATGEPSFGGADEHQIVLGDADSATMSVRSGELELSRRVHVADRVVVDYELQGPGGAEFVWAFHALVCPSLGLRVEQDASVVVGQDHNGLLREDVWPRVGVNPRFDVCGPDDGSARFALLPRARRVRVISGERALTFSLASSDDLPLAFGMWRNLGGYSWDGSTPYRSVGVEPLIGWDVWGDAKRVPASLPESGRVSWSLTISVGSFSTH